MERVIALEMSETDIIAAAAAVLETEESCVLSQGSIGKSPRSGSSQYNAVVSDDDAHYITNGFSSISYSLNGKLVVLIVVLLCVVWSGSAVSTIGNMQAILRRLWVGLFLTRDLFMVNNNDMLYNIQNDPIGVWLR
jgi:hypothetical protein